MEFIFELIFEIIVDGSIELTSHKKVPMPLRILAFIVVFGVFGLLASAIIMAGFSFLSEDNISAAIVFFIIGGLLIVGFFYMLRKTYKENTKEEDERINALEVGPSHKGQMIMVAVCAILIVIIGSYVLYTFDLFE